MKDWQQKGREFEDVCEDIIVSCFPTRYWVVDREWTASYGRIDFFVRRKGVGGRRLVIECKHMPVAGLRRMDVDQALRYKRSGARDAILLLSENTPVPTRVAEYAKRKKVVLLFVVWRERRELVAFIRNVATVFWRLR